MGVFAIWLFIAYVYFINIISVSIKYLVQNKNPGSSTFRFLIKWLTMKRKELE